jgi:uncharacterized protein
LRCIQATGFEGISGRLSLFFDSRGSHPYDPPAMVSERLPVHIDPVRCADQSRKFSGSISLAKMDRLQGLIVSDSGNAQVTIEGGTDLEGQRYIGGRISTEVVMACQRCLESVDYPIETQFCLAPINDEAELEQLSSQYEPLLFDGQPLYLQDLLEDEIILALPPVALHPKGECEQWEGAQQYEGDVGEEIATPQAEEKKSENPFELLRKLKQ